MAIHGYMESYISVNGEKLTEYQPEVALVDHAVDDGMPTTVTYVEVEKDSNFEIVVSISGRYHLPLDCDGVVWDFLFDGTKASGKPMPARHFLPGKTLTARKNGVTYKENNEWFLSKFKFGNLKITDGHTDSYPEFKQQYEHLGTIEVRAWTFIGKESQRYSRRAHASLDSVSEKILKGRAITMNARFDNAHPYQKEVNKWHIERKITRLATFKFHYRSRESLYQLGVIGKTRRPVPLEERELDSLTNTELRHLVRKQQASLNAQRHIMVKMETKLKRERSPDRLDRVQEAPQAKRRPQPIEVIVIDSD